MKTRRGNCWKLRHCRALTLVEVVASLVLLGSLLVGILVAHRRHAEQIRRASRRLAAVEAADRLLLRWAEQGIWGPTEPTGPCEGTPNLHWQWSVIREPPLERLGAAKGRLEVFDNLSTGGTPLVRLELLTAGGGYVATTPGKTP